jgi:hypothetical protein
MPIVSHMRARGAITTFTRAKGQAGIDNANKLAKEGPRNVLQSKPPRPNFK